MKQRLLSMLLNPYVLTAVIAITVILILPEYFNRFNIIKVSQENLGGDDSRNYYADLDGDDKSEQIIAQTNVLGNASYLLYKSNGDFIDQFNFTTQFPNEYKGLWFQDANANGFKEIYLISQSQDSLFLNVFEPLSDEKTLREHLFVDTIPPYNNSNTILNFISTAYHNIKSKENEVLFNIFAGYSGYPRHIYKYDFADESIIKSPHLTNHPTIIEMNDIDQDGQDEIFMSTSAAANTIDSIFTIRSDYSTWLNVLDEDLQFLFEPKEYAALGNIKTYPIQTDSGIKLIGVFLSRQYQSIPSKIFEISLTGQILNEVVLPESNKLLTYKIKDKSVGVYYVNLGKMLVFDSDLQQIGQYTIEPIYINLFNHDLNNNGQKEWIAFHNDKQTVSIFNNEFKDKVSFKITEFQSVETIYAVIKQLNANENQLSFQKGKVVTLFSYRENPIYAFKYIMYLLIYVLILGLVWLVIKGQKLREAKQKAIAQEIADLQLKTIKNQVDPHFVFNAINTISEMTLMDNKMEADAFISRFSGFMRDTLMHSDKISTTLKDELDYTENFIRLQQIRFSNSFKYQIEVDKSVKLKTLVPKHVLYCYVENAIKHGLSHKKDGLLNIKVSQNANLLKLSIEDNGGGLQKTGISKSNSTGNGLKIMDKIFELYTQYTKRKITQKLVELIEGNTNVGIRIEITIEKEKLKT